MKLNKHDVLQMFCAHAWEIVTIAKDGTPDMRRCTKCRLYQKAHIVQITWKNINL